jgi:hypothetical protein
MYKYNNVQGFLVNEEFAKIGEGASSRHEASRHRFQSKRKVREVNSEKLLPVDDVASSQAEARDKRVCVKSLDCASPGKRRVGLLSYNFAKFVGADILEMAQTLSEPRLVFCTCCVQELLDCWLTPIHIFNSRKYSFSCFTLLQQSNEFNSTAAILPLVGSSLFPGIPDMYYY